MGLRRARQEPHRRPFWLVGGTSEHEKLGRARDQCREILKYVNEAVRHTENRHRVEGYQKRLDTTSLDRASNPLAAEFKVGGRAWPARHALTHTAPRGAELWAGPGAGAGGKGLSKDGTPALAYTHPGAARQAAPQGGRTVGTGPALQTRGCFSGRDWAEGAGRWLCS